MVYKCIDMSNNSNGWLVRACVRVCVSARVRVCAYTCMCVCVYTYVCACVCMYTRACTQLVTYRVLAPHAVIVLKSSEATTGPMADVAVTVHNKIPLQPLVRYP